MYTIDTNIAIYYLHNEPEAVFFFDQVIELKTPIFLSGVSETELLSYSSFDQKEIQKIEDVIAFCNVIQTNHQINRLAAKIRREHKVKTIDAIIAATALFTNTTLVSRNIKDFNKIPGLQLLKI